MLIRLSPVVVCCLTLLFSVSKGLAQEKNVTTDERVLRFNSGDTGTWIPWTADPDNNEPGIFQEITALILNEAGFVSEPTILSTKRAIRALENGVIDFDFVNPDWFPEGKVGDEFSFTQPVIMVKEYFITLPAKKDEIKTTDDIYGDVVGTILGYYYYDDSRFKRMDFVSERGLVVGLSKRRFDVAILEEMTARYWSRKTKVDIHFAVAHTSGYMVMRLNKAKARFVPDLNRAIVRLKQDKKLEHVLDKYRQLYDFY